MKRPFDIGFSRRPPLTSQRINRKNGPGPDFETDTSKIARKYLWQLSEA